MPLPKPRFAKLALDELLHSFSPCKPQPKRPSFPLQPQLQIKKRTTRPLHHHPFSDSPESGRVGGELKLESIRKLPSARARPAQDPIQFRLALPLFRVQSVHIAVEGSCLYLLRAALIGLPWRRRRSRLRAREESEQENGCCSRQNCLHRSASAAAFQSCMPLR